MIGALLAIIMGLAAVGDSITAGAGATASTGYAAQASVQYVGHGSQCLVYTGCGYGLPLVATFKDDIRALPTRPSVVVLEIGVNDLAHVTDDQLMTGYRNIVAQGVDMGVRVIVGTIPPSNKTWPWHDAIQPQRLRVNDLIRKRGTYVDYASVLEGDLRRLRPAYDSGDGLHPNRDGHAVMAQRLLTWWGNHG